MYPSPQLLITKRLIRKKNGNKESYIIQIKLILHARETFKLMFYMKERKKEKWRLISNNIWYWSLSRKFNIFFYILSILLIYKEWILYQRNNSNLSDFKILKKNTKQEKPKKNTIFFMRKIRDICFSLIVTFPKLFKMTNVLFNTYIFLFRIYYLKIKNSWIQDKKL